MGVEKHVCSPDCFVIVRDGVKLKTRECKRKLAEENRRFHERFKAKRKMWLGEKR